jgi:hypothetical protein
MEHAMGKKSSTMVWTAGLKEREDVEDRSVEGK